MGQTVSREVTFRLSNFVCFSTLKLMEILSNDATHDIASWLPHVSNKAAQQVPKANIGS